MPKQTRRDKSPEESKLPIRVPPTALDETIAETVARHTTRQLEHASNFLTYGADEHLLLPLAIGFYLATRLGAEAAKRNGNHVLLTAAVTAALPHALKRIFNQRRPDRLTVLGHLRGVPLSGRRLDAFPSGHAIHVGALASAATRLPPVARNAVWAAGAALVTTRIVLLAHWVTDVAAGLALGVLTERFLRNVTGYGRESRKPAPDQAKTTNAVTIGTPGN